MSRRFADECDPLQELLSVLDFNGIRYRKEEDGVRFVFVEDGRRWETVGRAAPGMLLLYGVYPFDAGDGGQALRRMNEINAMLANGGLFVSEGKLVLRTGADLFDAYSAREAVTRALEYNAGAIVRFWRALQEAAQ